MSTCPRCGTVLPPEAACCPACGTVLKTAPPDFKRTMLGMSPQPQQSQRQPPQSQHEPQRPAPGPVAAGAPDLGRTMVGLAPRPTPATSKWPNQPAPPSAVPRRPVAPVGPIGPSPVTPLGAIAPTQPLKSTMLGVAMPGIAPLAPETPKEDDPVYASARPRQTQPDWTAHSAQPSHPSSADDARAHRSARKKRARQSRLAALIAIGAAGGLIGGALILVLLGRAPPRFQAEGRVNAAGNDVLHLACTNCPDGTVVTLGNQSVPLDHQVAEFVLPKPFVTGDNSFLLAVHGPHSRESRVDLVVPVAYRLRPDTTRLDGDRPMLRVAVESTRQTQITIAGTDVVLGSDGRGIYESDVTADCTGTSDEPTFLDKRLAYEARTGDKVERGAMAVRVPIPALRIDTPNPATVVETDSVVVSGRTARGARISLGSSTAPTSGEGDFSVAVPLVPGETELVLRSSLAGYASRLVHLHVKRVARLSDEARAFAASAKISFSDVVGNPGALSGQPIVLEGEIFDLRPRPHASIGLIEIAKGCSSQPCLARVLFADGAFAVGNRVRVFGHFLRLVQGPATAGANAAPVPEISADFALPVGR